MGVRTISPVDLNVIGVGITMALDIAIEILGFVLFVVSKDTWLEIVLTIRLWGDRLRPKLLTRVKLKIAANAQWFKEECMLWTRPP